MLAIVLSVLITAAPGTDPGRLDEAIELYQAARYAEALEVLDALRAAENDGSPDPAAPQESVAEYRALCLLALNREGEAQMAIKELVLARPAYRPRREELPPRLVTLVDRVRAEQMPGIIKGEYRQGKASFDLKAYSEAQEHFRRVIELLEADGANAGLQESMADVKELASGFLEIIDKSAAASPEGNAAGSPPANGAPAAGTGAGLPAPAPEAPVPAAPAVVPYRVYDPSDGNVKPPVAISQELPRWRSSPTDRPRVSPLSTGMLEVVVDTTGKVENARLTVPIHPLYDPRLLAAARKWQYRPATRDGVPVRYRKTIEVKLVGEEARRVP